MHTVHRSPLRTRRLFSAISASACALVLTAAVANAAVVEDDGEEAGKAEACNFIGCANGNRECGKATGKISSGMPPFVGEIKVSWTCYENGPQV